ncbi:immunoglobulin domain-containing protein [Horticoccus sp. 23ND18S-11]|uniref:immunoglobulin domain-containing protein n=1 Tax=Horticoccus sp. 23ND18S-11 TaxID=3391832 RepID=UPI0039C91E44
MTLHRNLLAIGVFLSSALGLNATIGVSLQSQLGNPSSATADPANRGNYLIQRAQYALGYNDLTREANWVAWDLTTTDVGGSGRSDFSVDTTLPAGFTAVLTTDYSGSGFDRGHMCPSGDRTVSVADNQFTFYMSNMVPQAPDNNQGVWANFESYCRTLAAAGNELLIISGPGGFAGSTLTTGVAIPGYVWKIAVVVPLGPGSALSRLNAATRVIALKIPNVQGIRSNPWQNYITSAAQLETDTGYSFFTDVPAALAATLRAKVDGQTAVGAPAIVTQPETQSAAVGGSVTFSVVASGDTPLAYQWLKDDAEIAGATSASLNIPVVQASSVGNYVVMVTNAVGSISSNQAALIVTGLPPAVVTPVAPQTVAAGSNVTLAVVASGSPTLSYQWRREGVTVPGATLSSLTLVDAQAANAGLYDVVIANSVNTILSNAALLTVTPAAPTIITQPLSQSATGGTIVTLSVVARGTAPLSYQWRKGTVGLLNGGSVAGATTATLTLTGVAAADAGSYDVVVTNAVSSVTSAAAQLTVNAATITWTFGADLANATANPTSGLPIDLTGGTVLQGNNNGTTVMLSTTSVSPTASGFSGTVNAGAAARIGALDKALSAYFEFTLTPAAAKKLIVAGLSFGSRQTGTGPQAYSVFSSFDNFTVPVASGTLLADSTWRVNTPGTFATVTGTTGAPVTFRIFGHSGLGSPAAGTANWRIDDLKVNVSTAEATSAVAPAVTSTSPASGALSVGVTSPITITFNQPVLINGPWFTINSLLTGPVAATVTGGPTTFTLTPPSNFAFGDTITVTVLAGTVIEKDTATLALPANHVFSFGTGLPVAPAIVQQPVARTISDGGSTTFAVAATGTAPLTYQWRKGGVPIAGNLSAATATLSLTGVTLADGGDYDCVVTNAANSATSSAALLTVLPVAVSIQKQPVSATVALGGTTSFTVQATGSAPISYSWRRNGTPLVNGPGVAGVATATLTLTGVQAASAGVYDVIVSNVVNPVTSLPATLGVTAATLETIVWDFATAAPTSGLPATLTGGVVTQGNNNGTTALLTAVSVSPTASGFSGGNNAGAAARIGALNTATSAYFEFTLTPAAGRQLVATGLTFGARSTGTGPQAFSVLTSIDNFTNPIASGVLLANSNWAAIAPAFAGVRGAPGTAVTFRIFGHNGTGSPGAGTANWRIDDLKLTAGTELPPALASTVPAAAATGVPVASSIAITFNQPVAATGTWFTITSAARGAVTATVSGGPTAFTLTPAVSWAYSDTVTVRVLAAGVRDTTGTLSLPADAVFSFQTAAPVPPTIVTQPLAQTATVGDTVTFTVAATGTAPMSYQWRKGGVPIVGNPSAATDTLTLTNVLTSAAGTYDCVVTNIATSVTSNAATLTVNKAPAGLTIGGVSAVYDHFAKSVSVSTLPAGLTTVVTYNGLQQPPTEAGSYTVVVTVVDANYEGSATVTLTIAPATGTITLSNLRQAYDGTPKSVSTATTPNGLSLVVTYDGSTTPPVYPGAYAVVATSGNPNYSATASGTLVIATTALVRHAPSIQGGLDGSIQVLLPEDIALNGNAWISGDLLVPGTPALSIRGQPTFAGVRDASGDAAPANHTVTLGGNAVLRYLVRRTAPVALSSSIPPFAVRGTRSVVLNDPTESAGDFATLRNLTVGRDAGDQTLPAGTYGAITLNGNRGLILGVAGATTPSVYRIASLVLNGNSRLILAGPVKLILASSVTFNESVENPGTPQWLALDLASGGLTLNGNATLRAIVKVPNGTVTLNGSSSLVGEVVSDRLVINGDSQLTASPE